MARRHELPRGGPTPLPEGAGRTTPSRGRYFTIPQAVEAYPGVLTERLIRRLVAERRIAFTYAGRRIVLAEADIEAYLEANRHEPVQRWRARPRDHSADRVVESGVSAEGAGLWLSPASRELRRALRPIEWVVLEDVALDARPDATGLLVAPTSARVVAEHLGLTPGAVARALARLRSAGILTHARQAGPGRALRAVGLRAGLGARPRGGRGAACTRHAPGPTRRRIATCGRAAHGSRGDR